MTCFWDALRSSLNIKDYEFANIKKPNSHKEFIQALQNNIQSMDNILWQNEIIKPQEIKEHISAIKEYNIRAINSGHLTSTCDSFLLLICSLFNLNIIQNYRGNIIKYTCHNPRRVIKFKNNSGHFQIN